MKSIRNTVTAAAAAAVMTAAFTGSAMAEAETTGSFGLDVNSAYIFRGATVNDEVNVMPTAEVTFYGITFGTWGNFNTDAEQFDEIFTIMEAAFGEVAGDDSGD